MINDSEFAILYRKICACFEPREGMRSSLRVEMGNKSLNFDNIDDFQGYTELPDTITNFSLSISQDDRGVSISRGILFDHFSVYASGDSEAWPAGVVETILATLSPHRTWYHWLNRVPSVILAPIMTIGALFPWASISPFSSKNPPVSMARISVSVTFLALFVMFSSFRNKLFPSGMIVVRETESWIKRNGTVLLAILTALSLLANLIERFL